MSGQRRGPRGPGIVGIEVTIAPGRELVPLPEGNRYLGFVFARGDSPGQVEAALRAALAKLRRAAAAASVRSARPAAGR